MARQKKNEEKKVEEITHADAKRVNLPSSEMQPVMTDKEKSSVRAVYQRRNQDLDPQLVWRGKDTQDLLDLEVPAPPLFVQEKIKPKVLIDDLRRVSQKEPEEDQPDLFADFNGLPSEDAKTEFYQHDCNWQNRMILGDSLQVMASLAEKEGMQGKVQCIYFDPPYGIKFNSNFQWSTTSRDVKDGKTEHITREPEQVKAFRDTWRDGIHSYLSYLRDRLSVARDLLTDSGSLFVQIGDENVHRVRVVMDEVFGEDNCISVISFRTTTGQAADILPRSGDYILWYAKQKTVLKYRRLYYDKDLSELDSYSNAMSVTDGSIRKLSPEENRGVVKTINAWKVFSAQNLRSQDSGGEENRKFVFRNKEFDCGPNHHWKSNPDTGLKRLAYAGRIQINGNTPNYIRFVEDYPVAEFTNKWDDTAVAGFSGDKKRYVVETSTKVIQRCLLLATDPGDLVLDPTCGSGTTAYIAEQWGRRWITIDTSRVALALARARIMGARYPYYLLADSPEGRTKEAELAQVLPVEKPTYKNIRHGFVCERVPHITLKSIANNAEIDAIYDRFMEQMEPVRAALNQKAKTAFEEWKIPREADDVWDEETKQLHAQWWELRIARQKAIDASIAAKADFETLYDRPYADNKKLRVAGPFTVESLSPHRYMAVDENDNAIYDDSKTTDMNPVNRFVETMLEVLKMAGVQQAHKDDKIKFTSLTPWPGDYICAEGRYDEKDVERRAAIFIGPEFSTVAREDVAAAAREAGDAGFDVLVTCAFSYDAQSNDLKKLGKIRILKATMNADLHMAGELKNTGTGNLFVIFGEPDIEIIDAGDNTIKVKVNGVDVFNPGTGKVISSEPDEIACWFIDTDYNEESFFVRHAYFLGANDPYSSLKTSLKAEINSEAWESLNSAVSRPFEKPETKRIAVKVINHLGDEVMKVFRVE